MTCPYPCRWPFAAGGCGGGVRCRASLPRWPLLSRLFALALLARLLGVVLLGLLLPKLARDDDGAERVLNRPVFRDDTDVASPVKSIERVPLGDRGETASGEIAGGGGMTAFFVVWIQAFSRTDTGVSCLTCLSRFEAIMFLFGARRRCEGERTGLALRDEPPPLTIDSDCMRCSTSCCCSCCC